MPRVAKMWVHTVDANGNELGDGRWVDIPTPDSFPTEGFAHIQSYVNRLLNSPANFPSLIVATPDQQVAVLLWQRGGVLQFHVSVEWRQEPDRERAIRQFFSERTLTTSLDYLAGNGGVPDATRCLGYILPADAQFITTLIKDVLRQVYCVRDQDALNFTCEEQVGPSDQPTTR